ncbi:hypothetical protein D5018_21320 [Parashewanella curva]|uniref:Uncharacterized protein n=1 Tax=Parashewanella curva TaxID=2338552 RepID=A0A3L8PR41_9GAMM|nr:hypothetical protein [Parashewanella curva]RLV57674.1 hypothetical protein D5018_21320 [Parashewanella curva]
MINSSTTSTTSTTSTCYSRNTSSPSPFTASLECKDAIDKQSLWESTCSMSEWRLVSRHPAHYVEKTALSAFLMKANTSNQHSSPAKECGQVDFSDWKRKEIERFVQFKNRKFSVNPVSSNRCLPLFKRSKSMIKLRRLKVMSEKGGRNPDNNDAIPHPLIRKFFIQNSNSSSSSKSFSLSNRSSTIYAESISSSTSRSESEWTTPPPLFDSIK